jgi:hypothetical protein
MEFSKRSSDDDPQAYMAPRKKSPNLDPFEGQNSDSQKNLGKSPMPKRPDLLMKKGDQKFVVSGIF